MALDVGIIHDREVEKGAGEVNPRCIFVYRRIGHKTVQ